MTKSKQILAYQEANPTHKPIDIAKACGVATAYVYQVLHKAKKKPKNVKLIAEATPTDGQQTLRKEIKHLNEAIDKWRNLSSFNEGRIDVLTRQVRDLKAHNSGLEYVISYLESRLGIEAKDGATV
jgi:hypothetical protein